jgi:hypothetical protein
MTAMAASRAGRRVMQQAQAPATAPRGNGNDVPPPTGALQALFSSLGGQPGKTVVLVQ